MNRIEEAITAMLEIAGIAASSGPDDDNPLIKSARLALESAHKEESVRDRGWWFNTDTVTLYPAQGGNVYLPQDCLRIDVIEAPQHCKIVARGDRLYDRENETYSIGAEVKVRMTRLIPIEDCPEEFWAMVRARACQKFATHPVGNPASAAYWAGEAQTALWNLKHENTIQLRPRVETPCAHRRMSIYGRW